jgi:hypothetical protein
MSHDEEKSRDGGDLVVVAHLAGGSERSGDRTVHLERRLSFLACLGMAFIMLNSWTGESRVSKGVLSGRNVCGGVLIRLTSRSAV